MNSFYVVIISWKFGDFILQNKILSEKGEINKKYGDFDPQSLFLPGFMFTILTPIYLLDKPYISVPPSNIIIVPSIIL